MFPNMGYVNPQLSNPYNSNNNNNMNMNMNMNMGNVNRPPNFMNMPNFNTLHQNPQLGSFPLQQFPQNFGQNPGFSGFPGNGQVGQNMNMNMNMGQGNPGQVFGQFGGWQQNQMQGQNVNQLGNLMLNTAQVVALSQLIGCVNQPGVVPQNPAFIRNSQLGLVQPNCLQQQQQQLQNVSTLPFNCALAQPQLNQPQPVQGNSGHLQNKNYGKNASKSNWRSGNSKGHQMHKANRKHKPFNINKGSAVSPAGPCKSAIQPKKVNWRLLYSEKEIQKWCQERKRNYPTKSSIQKKMAQMQANKDAADEEAKLRRNQLKEVLAKQAELGFELPEIPSHYLSDNEDQLHGRNKSKTTLKNRHNRFRKRGRFGKTNRGPMSRGPEDDDLGEHKRFGKRRKEGLPGVNEPTLIEKLLSTDIKRDRGRLLQGLRFMVMNFFFQDWPDKPLNFPEVIVKETWDEIDDIDDKHDVSLEEGEITD